VVHEISYPDHYKYTPRDLERMESVHGIQSIVTTEKDAVKLLSLELPENLFYLSVEARIEDEDTLMELLLKKIGTPSPGCLA